MSREAFPKPFIRLADGESLLQKTVLRAAAVSDGPIFTVANRDNYFLTRDEYAATRFPRSVEFEYLLEPVGRNTAPAIAAAAHAIQADYGDDAVLLVLAADHLIEDSVAFADAVAIAIKLATLGRLVTFGIQPVSPETGFGYIEAGNDCRSCTGAHSRAFCRETTARRSRNLFLLRATLLELRHVLLHRRCNLEGFRPLRPDVAKAVNACWQATVNSVPPRLLEPASFACVPDISIDYAVMEPAAAQGQVAVIPSSFGWSDIGTWSALANTLPADVHGNRVQGEVLLVNSENCYIHASHRVIAGIGIEDLLIVDTPDALLVAHRDQAQEVKQIVNLLRQKGHDSVSHHRTVHRPWGTYTVLEEGPRFKIKRIVVKPGAKLSLQKHRHRSEHWVVVAGTAVVNNGDLEVLVHTDESTYIPAGTSHRLSNPGVIDCVMIEVQSGDYVGEDDIVRLEDHYGRV